jgi:integral membrane protein (TIGR01906 family)
VYWALAAAIFVLSVPIALVAAQVNALMFDPSYYLQGQARHAIGRTTEYTLDRLRAVDLGIVAFFKQPSVELPVALADEGADRDVFNAREVGHMNDVRDIVGLIGRLQNLALTLIVAVTAARLASQGRAAVDWVARRTLAGAAATLALILAMGSLTLVDFERLFLTFHLLSFDNDLWQLDPRRDNLIRFFPFQFWFDATVTVALRSVFFAVVLAVAAWTVRRWEVRKAT